jgi:hypothetical protein
MSIQQAPFLQAVLPRKALRTHRSYEDLEAILGFVERSSKGRTVGSLRVSSTYALSINLDLESTDKRLSEVAFGCSRHLESKRKIT